MASNMNKVAKELKNAMEASDERKPKPYDTQAEVLRVEGGTAWVHIPGGIEETPVRLTINAKEGDMVNIHVANGSAWITGNGTNPPTDDTRAEQVYEAAGQSIDYVAQLVDKDVTVKSITAATGYIDDLYSKNIHTDNIEAATGYIHDLTADNITASDISAASGYIKDLTADHIDAEDIVADHATIDSLDANYAQIDMANVNNAWIENGTIKKAEVFDENVFDLSGNRATLSRIDASKINVANLRADNLIVRRINGQPVVGGYTLIDSNSPGYSSKNPQALGWYEFVNAQWVLSTDTTVDMTKAYYQEGNEVSLYDQTYIDGLENSLQQQIDGAVETYTGTVVPTLVNKPYTDWYDTSVTPIHDERAKHVGDIYYVVNSAASENGYCYRFTYDNTSHAYSWVLIKDSDVTKALSDISELKTFESNTTSWIDETDEGLETIRTNHTTLAGVVDKTVKESIQLWYTKANTTAPNKPTAEVTSTSTAGNAWRKVVPAYNASYPNYYYCWQYKFVDGSFAWSDVVRDIAMGETQGTARDAKNTADAALPASDFEVFESTTFTDLVDEVDEQSTTMTNMITRLGLSADGTQSSTDIVAKESALEQTVDGISTRVSKTETHLIGMYATCSTAKATKAKVATIVPAIPSGATWELTQGTTVTVKFTTANTHATPTLNVNGTGAKNIKSYANTSLDPDEYEWPAGSTFTFTYNGTNWLMQDSTASVRMNSAETSINQNADAITLEAASREAAVNLLLDSDAPNLGAVYASANRYISDASSTSEYVTANNVKLTDPPEQGIKYARRFVCNGTNTTSVGRAYAFYNTSENIIPYVPNTTYTATWWARCTNGQGQTNCHYPKFDGTTTNNTSERITLTSEWQKFTVVFTTGSTPNTNYNRIWFFARFPANTSGTIDICGCKLVAGDAVEAYSTKIEQTANNVLIQATASDTTAAQGGQHLIQSLINVAPSGVTIDASKVNITGVITAINNDTTTTIDGGKIAANSITASKMVLADYNNYITVTENDASSLISQNSEISNGWIYKNNATDSNTWLSPVLNQWATAGEKYRITGKLKMSAAGKCYVRIMARDADGAYKAGVSTETIDVGTTETDLNSVVTIPSSFSTYPKVNICIYFYAVISGSNVYKTGYCKQMKCERMSGGSLIVDGSITSDHISSNKIDANKIKVEDIEIDSAQIASGTIATARIPNLSAAKITSGTLDAARIGANSIEIGKIATDTQSQILNSNVLVGGRNLLLNTARPRTSPASAQDSGGVGSAYVTPGETLTDYGFSIANTASTKFTYSFDYTVTGNSAADAYIYVQMKGGQASGPTYAHNVKNNPTGHFTHTFTLTATQASSTSKTCGIRLRNATDGAVLTVSNVKLEVGNKETDWLPAPEDVINDNILVGSKKMGNWVCGPEGARTEGTEYAYVTLNCSNTSYAGSISTRPMLNPSTLNGTPLTISFDYTASVDTSIGISVCGSSQPEGYTGGTNSQTIYKVVTRTLSASSSYARYSTTLSALTSADLTSGSGDFNSLYFRIYTRTVGSVVKLRRVKLEYGSYATAWCESSKDYQTYITRINNAGIRIHPAATENDSVVINASGMEVFKGNVSVAKYGDEARVGKANSNHITINSDELLIYTGAESDGEAASFRSTGASIGALSIDDHSIFMGGAGSIIAPELVFNVVRGKGTNDSGSTVTGGKFLFGQLLYSAPTGGLLSMECGYHCSAAGYCARAFGKEVDAGYDHQTIIGKYNDNKSTSAFEIGWGTSDSARKNIFEVDTGGNVNIASSKAYKVNGTVVASARAKTTITPTASGVSNYSSYGNSYYEKAGNVVHVHVGVKGVTANTVVAIATLPSGYRPTSIVFGHGTGGTSDNIGYMDISTAGVIQVRSSTGYVGADVTYFV